MEHIPKYHDVTYKTTFANYNNTECSRICRNSLRCFAYLYFANMQSVGMEVEQEGCYVFNTPDQGEVPELDPKIKEKKNGDKKLN